MTEIRTVTRPDIKWLANELAATSGELERIDDELARLAVRRAHLEEVHRALSQVSGLVGAPALAFSVPAVRAHGKYGGRGQLRSWLKRLMQEAAPAALDTPTMVRLAEDAFDLKLASNDERDRRAPATDASTVPITSATSSASSARVRHRRRISMRLR